MNVDFFVGIFSQPYPRTLPLVGFDKRTSAGQPIPRYPRPTVSMTPEERRLAKYARYRNSMKGWERTRRYNSSPAHRQACQRYRDSHVRGPESCQREGRCGRVRWVNLMKVDPADKPAALWQAQHGRSRGGLNAAERMVMGLGLDPAVLHDEEAWNREHADSAGPFSNDHVRKFWTAKHRRSEATALRRARSGCEA